MMKKIISFAVSLTVSLFVLIFSNQGLAYAGTLSTEDILNKMSYYGDRSICKMTSDMAAAYSEVINGLPKTITDQYIGKCILRVTLADISGDGFPILITDYIGEMHQYYGNESAGNTKIFGYRDGNAYDSGINTYSLIFFGFMDGLGTIETYEDIAYDSPSCFSTLYASHFYTVSNGVITEKKRIDYYEAWDDNNDGTIDSGSAPSSAYYSSHDSFGEYSPTGIRGVKTSMLAENGWLYRNDVWSLILDNQGNNITDIVYKYGNSWEVAGFVDTNQYNTGTLNPGMEPSLTVNIDTIDAYAAISILKQYADAASVKVYVNGSKIDFDVFPEVVNGTTMLPVRYALEPLGVEFEWESGKIEVYSDKKHITLNIGSNIAMVNGSPKVMPLPATVVNGRTLVPLRFIAEELGYDVDWDGERQIVYINN